MKLRLPVVGWLVCWLLPLPLFAQLIITNPVQRMVFQRNQANQATIIVTGTAPPAATLIEARLVPLVVGQGQPTNWVALPRLASSTAFQGPLTASGGWYRLDVRAKNGATVLEQKQVFRVGIGEVFVVAGQSNALGGFEPGLGAGDDRVSCVDFRQERALDEQMFPLLFSKISSGTNIGPSNPPYIWGPLGDKLVARLNVPVLFLGAAQGGTSSTQWRQSAEGINDPDNNQPIPYRCLGVALLHYVARTGMRAVLWHQGESDNLNGISTQQYVDNIQYVITKSRQQTGFTRLPWLVSRVSYINNSTSSSIISAQNRLIAEVPDVFAGPSTDDMLNENRRADGVHFSSIGMVRLTDRWNENLTDAFFAQSQPFTPSDPTSLLTTGYTLPVKRRPGETIQIPSLRNNPTEADNTYKAQVIRSSDGAVVSESAPGQQNPLPVTLPANLASGTYQIRTLGTKPAWIGHAGEPFTVTPDAPPTPTQSTIGRVTYAGTPDPSITRIGYRYEAGSHGYYIMVEATSQVDVRMERIDGGPFDDSGWHQSPPRSQAPNYAEFADYNYVRFYPPVAFAVGGVEPGRYRLSVRRTGDTGNGYQIETYLLDSRQTVYIGQEAIAPVPPIISLTGLSPATPCPGQSFAVSFDVSEGSMSAGNTFSVLLSDATGSFANATTIGTGSGSPITATLPGGLSAGATYRIKVVGSNPAVESPPSEPLTFCSVTGGTADLSLTMQLTNRTPRIDQPVTYTIRVANDGPQAATGVVARSILPVGLSFIDASTPTISAADGIVTVNAGTIGNGTAVTYSFRAKAVQSGTFATAAQLTASNATDPDSQPNSGTGDGQDDAAMVYFRTADANGPLVASANPNQTPLPPVQGNQPAPDPAKADLSLGAFVSNQAPRPNDAITITLQVSNRGGLTASSATVQTLLPSGWQLTNTAGLSVNGQTVTGTLTNIPPNGSASLSLSVRVTGSGTIRSQLQSAAPADPDSTPGNGYTTGEDDEAAVSVRVP
ncbi:conserved repeat domain protein [Fibrisoma limi BUZ 3]|uniref:Conserved repeat domain protein n=1 Tax=Fibrisoma limi BUZ 3 TaxID=1185876 RepID=I2GMA9_9BACT|nr:sialate O-acetylesterase [Fibrisoma limi]CCH55036.1 conserved repeat domain protein [Fibrisoma limi BUZ 3]